MDNTHEYFAFRREPSFQAAFHTSTYNPLHNAAEEEEGDNNSSPQFPYISNSALSSPRRSMLPPLSPSDDLVFKLPYPPMSPPYDAFSNSEEQERTHEIVSNQNKCTRKESDSSTDGIESGKTSKSGGGISLSYEDFQLGSLVKRRKIDARVIAVQMQREEPSQRVDTNGLREMSEKSNRTKREELLAEVQGGLPGDADLNRVQKSKERKRVQNRESAARCRKRQKEYIKALEEKVKALEEEKNSLVFDNMQIIAQRNTVQRQYDDLKRVMATARQNPFNERQSNSQLASLISPIDSQRFRRQQNNETRRRVFGETEPDREESSVLLQESKSPRENQYYSRSQFQLQNGPFPKQRNELRGGHNLFDHRVVRGHKAGTPNTDPIGLIVSRPDIFLYSVCMALFCMLTLYATSDGIHAEFSSRYGRFLVEGQKTQKYWGERILFILTAMRSIVLVVYVAAFFLLRKLGCIGIAKLRKWVVLKWRRKYREYKKV